MIVTCPNCSSRYRIDPSKIRGRGAKITCPTCAHKFVVYREEAGDGSPPSTATPAPKSGRSLESSTAPSAPPRQAADTTVGARVAFTPPTQNPPSTMGTPLGAVRVASPPVVPAPRVDATATPATAIARSNIPMGTPSPSPAAPRRASPSATPPTTLAFDAARPSRFGVPADIARRDFRKFGLTWKVRKGIGLTYDFYDLATLREYMDDGQVGSRDVLSYDAREWKMIAEIPSLEVYFWEIWTKAEKGELSLPEVPEEEEVEDESDAPTTIVGQGVSLADEIRRAVVAARTPAPVPERSGPMISAPAMLDVSGEVQRPAPLELQPTSTRNPTPPPVEAPPRRPGDDPFKVLEKATPEDGANGVGFGLLLAILFVFVVLAVGSLYLFGGIR